MTASPSNIEYGQIEPRDFAEAATINYRSFGTGSNPFSDAIEPLDTRPDYETRCKRAAIRMTRVFKSDKYLCMVARDTSKDGYVVGYAQWLKPGKPYEALDVSKLSEEEKEGFKGVSTDALEHMRVQMLNGREKVLGKDGQYWYLVLLAIDPEYQGKKIGSHLLQLGMDWAQRDGIPAVLEASPAGKILYERRGWKDEGEVTLTWLDEPLPLMVWRPKA